MSPRLIRSELDEGAQTWVPYGISVDVTDLERDLTDAADRIVDEHLSHRKAPATNATPRPKKRK